MEEEISPDQVLGIIEQTLRELHIVDNMDGTVTMKFVLGTAWAEEGEEEEPRAEFAQVIQGSMGEMFGEVLKTMVISDKFAETLSTAVDIPNAPE